MPTGDDVTVVVPTLEERASFELLAPRLQRALAPFVAEVIVVDDDSRDRIDELVGRLASPPRFRAVVRRGVRGLASAVVAGIREARGTVVVVMDADGSHPPEILPQLIGPILEDRADFVLASRGAPGGAAPGLHGGRRLISWGATRLARPLTRVSDPMSGYFAVRRTLIDPDRLAPLGYKIALELLVKCRPPRVVEVPFVFGERLAGTSKLDRGQMAAYVRHVLRLYAWRFGRAAVARSTR
ncbi:MAG TPA: polyprenol monophosphomannose synthase [Thermoplasmata archaeon]|nr:polyprenol monophosphomannose synthase [Thermoplasmata archaeon]